MNMKSIDTKYIQIAIVISALACLFLAGVEPGIFTLWVLSPLIVIYGCVVVAGRTGSNRHIVAAKGFLILALPLMWFIHILWYFDINGSKTAGSTSALIFAVLPVYTFILGVLGYVIGYAFGAKRPSD